MKEEQKELTIKMCAKQAQDVLEGRTIKQVRYMTDEECQHMGWFKKPVVLQLDNGTLAFISMDDEGNDGGSMFYVKGGTMGVIPTI